MTAVPRYVSLSTLDPPRKLKPRTSHAFFETDDRIELNIFVKDVPQEDVTLLIEPRKVVDDALPDTRPLISARLAVHLPLPGDALDTGSPPRGSRRRQKRNKSRESQG